jgi:hypothetical protein
VTNRGVLGDWYERASIRTAPRRVIGPDDLNCNDSLCFPEDLAPWVSHPLLAALSKDIKRAALAHQLFLYLAFTDALEHDVVNQTVRRIATGSSGLICPVEYRLDAYKIYCDEAYHSSFSADLAFQIQSVAKYVFHSGSMHPALALFRQRTQDVLPEDRYWLELLFVTVSETLVSGSLERIPKSPLVLRAVREMVADHLHDEIKHHAFFTQFFRLAWPQIPSVSQRRIAPMIPSFITAFLAPNEQGIREFLALHLTPHQADRVLAESYPPHMRLAEARGASGATRAIFRQAGLLECSATRDAFFHAGLERHSAAGAG